MEEVRASTSGEGVDEQMQLVDQTVSDQGPHKRPAAAYVDATIDFTFDPADTVGTAQLDMRLPMSCPILGSKP